MVPGIAATGLRQLAANRRAFLHHDIANVQALLLDVEREPALGGLLPRLRVERGPSAYGPGLTQLTEKLVLSLANGEGIAFVLPVSSTMVMV